MKLEMWFYLQFLSAGKIMESLVQLHVQKGRTEIIPSFLFPPEKNYP